MQMARKGLRITYALMQSGLPKEAVWRVSPLISKEYAASQGKQDRYLPNVPIGK